MATPADDDLTVADEARNRRGAPMPLRRVRAGFTGVAATAIVALASSVAGAKSVPALEDPDDRVGEHQLDLVGQFGLEPQDVLVLPNGDTLFLMATPPRIARWSQDAEPLPDVAIEMSRPVEMAAAADSTFWLLDAGRRDARLVDVDGTVSTSVDLLGRAHAPASIDAGFGWVAVADAGAHRVLLFEGDRLVARAGRAGSGDGELLEPSAVKLFDADPTEAVERQLLVADSGNHRVQRYSLEGLSTVNLSVVVDAADANQLTQAETLGSFGEFGPFPGLFAKPVGLELHDDRLYVVEEQNHRVQVFDWSVGSFDAPARLYEWGIHVLRPGEGAGRLHYPRRVRVGRSPESDNIYALVVEPFADRIQFFGPAAGPASKYMNDPAVMGGKVSAHLGSAVAARGSLVAMIEPESQEIRLLDVRADTPIEIGRFGGQGDEVGRMRGLLDLDFGAALENGEADRLFAIDRLTRRLSEVVIDFDPAAEVGFSYQRMQLGRSLDLARLDNGVDPLAIAVAGDGRIAVLNGDRGDLLLFDSELALQRRVRASLGKEFVRPDLLPIGLCFASDGDAVVVAGSDASGAPRLLSVPIDESGDGVVSYDPDGVVEPSGITPFRDGFAVSDRLSERIVFFDRGMTKTGEIGDQAGLGPSQFHRPRGVAVDGIGRLIVLDHGNHRMQVIGDEGFEAVFGPRLYAQPARPGRRR